MTLAQIGGLIWLGACLTVYFGFTGFLGIVTAFGTAFELKFLRFPTQLFGMVVSLHWLCRERLHCKVGFPLPMKAK